MLKARYYQNDGSEGKAQALPEWLFDGVVHEDVLHQVIPRVPLPHDAGVVWRRGLELDHPVWPNAVLGDHVDAAADGACFLGAFVLPRDGQDVAVGHAVEVVVQQVICTGKEVVPDHLAVPSDLWHSPALPAAVEYVDLRLTTAPDDVAVVQQVGRAGRRELTLPGVDDDAIVVDTTTLEISTVIQKIEKLVRETLPDACSKC